MTGLELLIFEAELTQCPSCGGALRTIYWHRPRHIKQLSGTILVREQKKACVKEPCDFFQQPLPSARLRSLALRNMVFGVDVILKVGELRKVNHLTIDEVREKLMRDDHLEVSRAEIPVLERRWYNLLVCVQESQIPQLRAEFEERGGYVLCIDGTVSDGSRTLYIFRDLVSQLSLAAYVAKANNSVELKACLKDITANFGLPRAVISDKEEAIVSAVKAVMPGVRHQLCQWHFLKNLGKAIMGELYNDLKALFKKKSRESIVLPNSW